MDIKEVRSHHIPAQNKVDPIDIFICWYGEDKSQVTIRCWDSAWTAFRGGHSSEKVEKYLLDCLEMGLDDHLVELFSRTRSPREIKWLTRIFNNIHLYLKDLDLDLENA